MDSKVKKMILVSLFSALTAIGGFFKIPLPPVPFTLQIFFVVLSGLLLGGRLGFLSQAIYITLGLIGVPIFAYGGGLNYIFNPTFGYLIGFSIAAFIIGKGTEKSDKVTFKNAFLYSFIGLIVSYIIGVPYLYIIFKYVNGTGITFLGAIKSGFLLFLPWDLIKIGFAAWIAKQVVGRVGSVVGVRSD